MATRYQVSLAHEGCANTGTVVWEERGMADAAGATRPVVVSLPRGFVSVTAEDGSVEILCSGCAQTVAAATTQRPANQEERQEVTAPAADASEPSAPPATESDLDLLFAEHPDVPPIRGDSIPNHLVDRLRHLASRLRGGAI